MMRTERQRLTGWMMWVVMVALSVMTLWLGGRCAVAQRRGPAAKKEVAETSGVVLLDTYGFWRMHFTLAPPMLATGESVKVKHEWMNYKTPGPGEGWQDVGFDDSSWLKGPLTISLKTPLLARACARGKVMVSNPGAVKGLKLSVSYKGGLIVTVNGKEVKREGIAAGAKLAEGPVGQERSVEDLAIPSGLLKKGVNVVGLEVVRAAHEQQADYYFEHGCEIVSARLSVSSGNGVQANVVRPKGFQVWNADAMATDFTLDFGDACEELRPVKIVGTRNGRFTGKVMVGSDKAIRGLKVRPGALSGQGGSIPAEKVHVRYGRQWGMQRVAAPRTEPYATWANRLGELVDEAPETVEVMVPEKWSWYGFPHKPAFTPVSGAVVPVWLTVEVPADTKAGSYSGSVTISAKGEKGVRVPVSLSVSDYVLPDTQDYRTWVDVIQCPDTLALEYGVEMWSEKHWEMIAKSFRLIGQTGSRTVYVPLIAHTNLGNEESMVRWVKRADGTYGYDFSILERYLDVAEKEMGTPKVVILVVWETYMMPTIDASGDKKTTPRGRQRQMAQFLTGRQGATIGHGPLVTVVDGKSGKKENVYLPTLFETEASKALWEPLMKGVRERLDKRGLGKAMMMGLLSDAWPKEEELAFFEGLTGGAPWVIQSHEGLSKRRKIYNKYEVGYQTAVWSVTYSDDNGHRPPGGYYGQGVESHRGWSRPDLKAAFDRSNGRYMFQPTGRWHHYGEVQITGGQRGQGRIGGEYWKVLRNKRGARVGLSHERYPESHWRQLCITTSLLAPGPDGPVATDFMESFRDGIQECEARIVLERALGDDAVRAKLGDDLAKRCKDYLYGRHMMMWLSLSSLQTHGSKNNPGKWRSSWSGQNLNGNRWFVSSDWQGRSQELFDLAGEVSRKIEAK